MSDGLYRTLRDEFASERPEVVPPDDRHNAPSEGRPRTLGEPWPVSKARDGEADAGELVQLREHLEGCPECAGRIEELRAFYMEIEDSPSEPRSRCNPRPRSVWFCA